MATLRTISCDVTSMDWARPTAATAARVALLHAPECTTVAVAESPLAEMLIHTRQYCAVYKGWISATSEQLV